VKQNKHLTGIDPLYLFTGHGTCFGAATRDHSGNLAQSFADGFVSSGPNVVGSNYIDLSVQTLAKFLLTGSRDNGYLLAKYIGLEHDNDLIPIGSKPPRGTGKTFRGCDHLKVVGADRAKYKVAVGIRGSHTLLTGPLITK